MTSSRPSGSSRYFRMRFIDLLSSAPVTGAKNPNHLTAVRKAYGQHAIAGLSKAIEPCFAFAVREIPSDHTCWIQKSKLRVSKRHAVLTLVLGVLGPIPLEAWAHPQKYSRRMGLAPYVNMGSDL